MFKKFCTLILGFVVCCFMAACGPMEKQTPEAIRAQHSKQVKDRCELIDITFNGETHEYVRYLDGLGDHQYGSLTHWAGCKFCKEHSTENKDWLLF